MQITNSRPSDFGYEQSKWNCVILTRYVEDKYGKTYLVRALELNADFKTNFDDVKSTDYYDNSLGIAKALGITTGVGNNKFNPREQITRKDMMVLVARAMKIAGKVKTIGAASEPILQSNINNLNEI